MQKTNIKLILNDTEKGNTRLEFKISGNNINYVIMNTIRRSILSYIPIYAFTSFNFEKNTSIYNNNYIKLRLNNLPIWGIENKLTFIDNEIKNNEIKEKEEDSDSEEEIDLNSDTDVNASSLKQMTMYINYKNKTNNNITVTTNDANFYFAESQIENPYNVAIQIVKLQPNQEISFSSITSIGCEQNNGSIFSPVSVCAYKEIKSNEFDFFIESRGQLTEINIISIAIDNIIKRINNFILLMKETNVDDMSEGVIELKNEDHTLGNLISKGLQEHKDISFGGYRMIHPCSKKIEISYNKKEGSKKNIVGIIKEVTDEYIDLFNDIKKLISKL